MMIFFCDWFSRNSRKEEKAEFFMFGSSVDLGLGFRSVELNGRDHGRSECHQPGRRLPQEEPNTSLQHQETPVLLRQSRQGSLALSLSICTYCDLGY
jgi:hypothetical protein